MAQSNEQEGDELETLYKDEANYVLHMLSLPTEDRPIHVMLRAKQRLADRKQHELEAEIRELKALMRLIDDRSGAPLTKTELGNRIVAKSERLGKS